MKRIPLSARTLSYDSPQLTEGVRRKELDAKNDTLSFSMVGTLEASNRGKEVLRSKCMKSKVDATDGKLIA